MNNVNNNQDRHELGSGDAIHKTVMSSNTVKNGKGSKQRPVDKKQFDENFDKIWKKKEGEE